MSAFLPVEALASLSPHALGLLRASDVQGVGGTGNAAAAAGAAGGSTAPVGGFGQMVADGITRINGQLMEGQVDLQRLALGDAQNLHRLMIRLEESRLSFQLMMQVRSRVLEAYQDVMKMPL